MHSDEQPATNKDENLYAGEILKFWQVAQTNVKYIWAEGTMHKGTWHENDPQSQYRIFPEYAHFGPMLVGACDAIIDEIMGIPLIIRTGYQLMTDKQQRQAFRQIFTREGFNALKTSLKEEIKQTFTDEQLFAYRSTNTVTTVAFAFVNGGGNILVKQGKNLKKIFDDLEGVAIKLKDCPRLSKYIDDLQKSGQNVSVKIAKISSNAEKVGSEQLEKLLKKTNDIEGAIDNLRSAFKEV